MKNKIAKFIKNSVDYLVVNQPSNCRYKLDDHLAIFVGWASGYGDEKRDDVIQDKINLDWGINAGIKVWTSDDMWCDYEWVNFPFYENGEVLDLELTISPQADYNRIAELLLEMYDKVKHFALNDKGMILEEVEIC